MAMQSQLYLHLHNDYLHLFLYLYLFHFHCNCPVYRHCHCHHHYTHAHQDNQGLQCSSNPGGRCCWAQSKTSCQCRCSISPSNTRFNLPPPDSDKYIFELGQIHFQIWTNTFVNLNKYISKTPPAAALWLLTSESAENCQIMPLTLFLVEALKNLNRKYLHKTGFKLMVTLQSGCVIEIPTLCRIHEIFKKKYHVKAFEQSFPMMYNTM